MNCSICGGPMVKKTMDVVAGSPVGQQVYKNTPTFVCQKCGNVVIPTSLTDSVNRLGDKEILLEGTR